MTEQDKQGAEPDLRNAPPAGLTPRQKEIQRRQFASEQQGAEREAFKTWWCASDEYNYAHTGSAASAWEAGRAALRAEQQQQKPVWWVGEYRGPYRMIGALFRSEDAAADFIAGEDGRYYPVTGPAPASQPVGEAVAYFRRLSEFGPWVECQSNDEGAVAMVKAVAPTGLSDDQITEVWNGMPGGHGGFLKQWGYVQFARAILARSGQPAQEGK